jgi:hypothetical protein
MRFHHLSILCEIFPGATFNFYRLHVIDLALDDVPLKSGHVYQPHVSSTEFE